MTLAAIALCSRVTVVGCCLFAIPCADEIHNAADEWRAASEVSGEYTLQCWHTRSDSPRSCDKATSVIEVPSYQLRYIHGGASMPQNGGGQFRTW